MAGTIPAHSRDGAFTITDDAGHSATLLYHLGDHAMDNLMADGAQVDVVESAGHVVGLRQAARAIPTFSVSAVNCAGISDYEQLVLGEASGFVSTTLGIGEAKTVDLSWTFSYGAETRGFSFEDCVFTLGKKAGSPSDTVSYQVTVYGPVKARDLSGNWVTIIAAR